MTMSNYEPSNGWYVVADARFFNNDGTPSEVKRLCVGPFQYEQAAIEHSDWLVNTPEGEAVLDHQGSTYIKVQHSEGMSREGLVFSVPMCGNTGLDKHLTLH
jgi:hypothetical protein